jgi:translation initiation factor 1
VTVVYGFHHIDKDIEALARNLKLHCGAGGTAKDERIEIQGDHRENIGKYLKEKGYKVTVQK